MIDPSAYARQIETYLCQKNGGHLIRVVGPAFEMVCSWATRGVPLKVALRGIDRCCERHDRKRPRRRPVRIEFCEADVLDAFDAWRRAIGVGAAGDEAGVEGARKPALAAHLDRAIARLAHVRGVGAATTDFHRCLDEIVRHLEEMASSASHVRGDARARLVARLADLDARMMDAAISQLARDRVEALRTEAAEELAPFGARMTEDARRRAMQAAFARLVRESAGLPTLLYG